MLILSRGTWNENAPGECERGFTLLEIIIVISLIALFFGMAVPRLPDMAGTRIQQNARKVSMMIQLARRKAVSFRRYYRVNMDLRENTLSASYYGPEGTYVEDEEVRIVSLRESTITDVVNSTEGKVLDGTGWIRISPRGFIQPSMVHLRDGQERNVTIVPSPVSGRVRIEEGYTEFAGR